MLDLMMPIMDGYAVLEALRHDDRTSQVPLVMLSAVGTPEVVQRCLELGASIYLAKPFEGDELIQAVRSVLPSSPS